MAAVYNLTVEGEHEYYANGVLVHNCDAVAGAFNHLALPETSKDPTYNPLSLVRTVGRR